MHKELARQPLKISTYAIQAATSKAFEQGLFVWASMEELMAYWLAWWQARDPIPQFKQWVLDEKVLSEQQLSEIDKEVEAVVEEAVQFADESPKPVGPPNPLFLKPPP